MNNAAIRVAAAIIRRDNKILIGRRGAKSFLSGKWEFPGGKVEPGEDFTACLCREIKEELGVAIRVVRPFQRVSHDYGDKGTVELHSFICDIAAGEPEISHSHSEVRWIAPAEISAYDFVPADIAIARDVAIGAAMLFS